MKSFSLIHRILISLCASAVLLFCLDLAIPAGEGEIYKTLIRLHVLAESDGEEDQAVKLLVRDAILKECGDLFAETSTTEEALAGIEAAASRMEAVANRVLEEQGVPYTAKAVFGREQYPACEYDGVTFPAGEYYSLRILLGEGEGKNWWCCLFPPLCMNAADAEDSLESVGMDPASGKVFTKKKYTVRFKLLEWFSCFFE